jgi:SnoaL-like polyketide cyclase
MIDQHLNQRAGGRSFAQTVNIGGLIAMTVGARPCRCDGGSQLGSLLQYSLPAPRRGRDDVKAFMTAFRDAFPDLNFWGTADLIAEGDYVVGRREGGGTHTGPAFDDFLIGSLPARSGRKMRFTGTTVSMLSGSSRILPTGSSSARPSKDGKHGRLMSAQRSSASGRSGQRRVRFMLWPSIRAIVEVT